MRVVLDTNTVLSALLFPHGRLTWMREMWMSGRILPLVNRDTARELIDALAYPKFKLDETGIRTLLGVYLPFSETVDMRDGTGVDVPVCSDPDDQKFVHLAAGGRAEVLVSGDRAVLALAGTATFAIETPAQFQKRFV